MFQWSWPMGRWGGGSPGGDRGSRVCEGKIKRVVSSRRDRTDRRSRRGSSTSRRSRRPRAYSGECGPSRGRIFPSSRRGLAAVKILSPSVPRFSDNQTSKERSRRSMKIKNSIVVSLVFLTLLLAGCKKQEEKHPSTQPHLVRLITVSSPPGSSQYLTGAVTARVQRRP